MLLSSYYIYDAPLYVNINSKSWLCETKLEYFIMSELSVQFLEIEGNQFIEFCVGIITLFVLDIWTCWICLILGWNDFCLNSIVKIHSTVVLWLQWSVFLIPQNLILIVQQHGHTLISHLHINYVLIQFWSSFHDWG